MKYNRHAKMLEIIENQPVETQEDLAAFLREAGHEVTQATVSRDIKDLRLIKIAGSNGKNRYVSFPQQDGSVSNKLLNVFMESFTGADYANNIVVVKTLPGMAQACAFAIDSMKWSEIIGTIAGDDTVMIICRAEVIAEKLVDKFIRMAGGI